MTEGLNKLPACAVQTWSHVAPPVPDTYQQLPSMLRPLAVQPWKFGMTGGGGDGGGGDGTQAQAGLQADGHSVDPLTVPPLAR